jgi:hypothetical protein
MKFLVKAKRGNTLIGRDRTKFLDEFRYRVYDIESDVREWDSRKLIDIKATLKDEATDDVFKTYFFAKGDNGIDEFVKEYSNKAEKVAEEPKVAEEQPKVVEEQPKQNVPQKKVKKYKNR